MQSGFSAIRASASAVASTPVSGRPASVPASLPILVAPWAKTPTSSSRSSSRIARSAEAPTMPVVHCTTRTCAISRLPYDVEAGGGRAQAPPHGGWFRVRIEPQLREAVQQRPHEHLRLHLRKVLTDAQVCAVPEADVGLTLTREVEAVGVRPSRRVAVGRTQINDDR